MSGHSKWSTIKRKKELVDSKRGKIFTKIAREIMVAAKEGGGDPGGNPRLRAALASARAANMPRDNQERAIKKGTGELEGVHFEQMQYEGRGPQNSAFIVEALTDNKNRTVAEIRRLFTKAGGELGSSGSVMWMFEHKGVLEIAKERISEDTLIEQALGAGAEDVQDWDEVWGVVCNPTQLHQVQEELASLEPTFELRYLTKPESEQAFMGEDAISVAKFWATLEEQDDVQACFSNAQIPPEIMEEYGP